MGKFKSGLGQRYLSLPNDEGQDLVITQVSVGLRAKLKQLPYNHSQRPGKKEKRETMTLYSAFVTHQTLWKDEVNLGTDSDKAIYKLFL